MILILTVDVLAVTAVTRSRFNWHSVFTWSWFVLYVGIPANAAYYLWRSRKSPWLPETFSPLWRTYLWMQGVILAAYGLATLALPEPLTSFWPWPIDAFHGQVYSAVFLTLSLGALLLLKSAAGPDLVALGLTQLVFGVLAIAGLLLVKCCARQGGLVAGWHLDLASSGGAARDGGFGDDLVQ
jgi:hypothetical protein